MIKDLLRKLVERQGRMPLMRGIDAEGRFWSYYLHPAAPRRDDKLCFVWVCDDESLVPAPNITVEQSPAEILQRIEMLSLLLHAHDNDDEDGHPRLRSL